MVLKIRYGRSIQSLFQKEEKVIGLRFAHNRGHQNAILRGMMYARKYCDFVITIDADLQQDIETMDRFIKEYYAGNEDCIWSKKFQEYRFFL